MRLALKLGMSLAATTLLVLGVAAIVDRRHREELVLLDIDAEMRAARALRVLATAVAEQAGADAARHMIQAGDAQLPRNVRWLALDEIPTVEGRDLRREVETRLSAGDPDPVWAIRGTDGDEHRYMYIPVTLLAQPPAVIELSESLAPRVAYYRRAQMETATIGLVVVMLSATLAGVFGRRLIRRPLDAITAGVRAFGEGRYGELHVPPQHDEIGELGSELARLGERLAARERLLHEDRLRTIGQLASGVAHELGTPLSVIGVRAQPIASGEVAGDEAVDNAKAIIEQTNRMTAIVRQLLDYARRPGGQPAIVDAGDVARRTREMLEPLARARGVTLESAAAPDPIDVHVDPRQLEQVLTNLVLNAIQAIGAGGHVRITTGRGRLAPPPGRGGRAAERCWVEVADDGPGIPAEHLSHVFEPFFTTKGVGEGTGLGLAVALAIVEEHGGWIDVQSEPGRGARFRVVLPAADAAAERLAS